MNLGRALVLVAVAVVLGIVLLQVATKSPSVPASATASPPATHHHRTPPPTTTTTVPLSSIHVLVANGVGYGDLASEFGSQLQGQGYSVLPAEDATSTVPASVVYYAPGSQPQATTVAKALGLQPSVVQPLSSSVPVSSSTGANVVVIIGPDLAAKAPGSSTTAGGSTSTT